jgi:hypothetical protein
MSQKPQIVGIDGVMDWYDRFSTSPYYAVYTYTSPTKLEKNFQYTGSDKEEGRILLANTLEAMQMQEDQTLYCLKLYDQINKKNTIDSNLESIASIRFRITEIPQLAMQHIAGMDRGNSRLENAITKLAENQNLILSKLSADEFEEDEPKQENLFVKMLENPAIQGLAIAGISKLLGLGETQIANTGIAGISGLNELNEDEVISIVNSLMSKGVTIEHLRKLDEMNAAKLQSLLFML